MYPSCLATRCVHWILLAWQVLSEGFSRVLQESILAVLNSDYGQVQKLVEEAVRQLSAAAASSTVTPLDKCQLMEQMNDNHVSQLLPRLRACDDQVAAFAQRCLDDKVRPLFPLICRVCPSSYAPFPS